MVSGQGFRRDKLLDRRSYLRLGRITKTFQAVHAIVRQTHAHRPDPTPSQTKNSTDLRKYHGSVRDQMEEARTPATHGLRRACFIRGF